ncbi:MAG TPA: hypothetical protein VFC00_04755 [Micromonosporaceae bacterium]|nr:hypothetical protein [Micromonosporaceae bacterium]
MAVQPDGAEPTSTPAPHEAAAELARMGIDPSTVGLPSNPQWTLSSPVRHAVWPAPARTEHSISVLGRPLDRARPGPRSWPDADARAEQLPRLLPDGIRFLVPAGWRRLIRTVTFGFLAPGAASTMERERQLVAQVRARQRGPRTILFVAGKGGVGTTTTAIGVASTLAALRTDTTALLDARYGTGSLGRRVAGIPAPNTLDLSEGGTVVPLAAGGLRLVDAPPWHSPIGRDKLVVVLEAMRTEYSFVAVDIGNDAGEATPAMLARADQMVVVASASKDAVEATRVALGRIHQVDPYRVGTVVVALVSLNPHGDRTVIRNLRAQLGLERGRIVFVPFDPGLATGDRFVPDQLHTTTREAYLRLAGMVAQVPS